MNQEEKFKVKITPEINKTKSEGCGKRFFIKWDLADFVTA